MSKLFAFLGLVFALVAIPADSFALPQPINAEKLLNLGSVRGPGVQLGYQVISNKVQLLKCKYDFTVLGGSSTVGALGLKAVDGSACQLPNKAIVIEGMIDVVTAPTSGGSATLAVGTGQAANDLKAATAVASFTGRLDVVPAGTAATAIKLTAARNPTLTIGTANLTAGKFNVYIQYLLGE